MKVATIVEGDGEVAAVPVLLRRIAEWRTPEVFTDVLPPIRVRRDRFLKLDEEFQRYLRLAAAKCEDDGWILVLLDADDDCPAQLAEQILARAAASIAHRKVSVVLAKREFEAWFVAAAESLNGYRGFSFDPAERIDAETPRDAKGWLRQRIASGVYGETTDQPAFAARFDLQQAFDGSRSFRKLCSEWDRQIPAA
jgi:hypothetical protein